MSQAKCCIYHSTPLKYSACRFVILEYSLGTIDDPHISNITRWYGQLMTQDVFRKTESEVTGSKGISAFKVINIKLICNISYSNMRG